MTIYLCVFQFNNVCSQRMIIPSGSLLQIKHIKGTDSLIFAISPYNHQLGTINRRVFVRDSCVIRGGEWGILPVMSPLFTR